MKYTLITLFWVTLFSFNVQAQTPQQKTPPSIEERWERTKVALQKEIQLDAVQSKSIAAIFKSFFTEADKIRKENPAPASKLKEGMLNLIKERDGKVKKIVTEPQFVKYKEVMEKLKPPPPDQAPKN
jgi:hypothetical protein